MAAAEATATTATETAATTNYCRDRPKFILATLRSVTQYQLKPQPPSAAVLEKPVKLAAGIPERNLLYLAPRVWSVAPALTLTAAATVAATLAAAVAHLSCYCGNQRRPLAAPLTFPFKRLFTSSRFELELYLDLARLWPVSCLQLVIKL